MFTTDVENYPGFADGIGGIEMMMEFKKQALRFDTRVVAEDIVEVDFSRRPFVLHSSGGEEVHAATVVLATGANARWLGVPGEERLAQSGGGVSACAVCDGALPVLSRPGARRGGRRRQRDGRGALPDQVCQRGAADSPARRAQGFADHAGAGAGQREDDVSVEQRGGRGAGRRRDHRAQAGAIRWRARGGRWRWGGCSWRSGTTRIRRSCVGRST